MLARPGRPLVDVSPAPSDADTADEALGARADSARSGARPPVRPAVVVSSALALAGGLVFALGAAARQQWRRCAPLRASPEGSSHLAEAPSGAKLIFINGLFADRKPGPVQDCDVPCSATDAPDALPKAHAVIWNPRWMQVFDQAPLTKPPGQRWVFNFFFEASTYLGRYVDFDTTSAIGPYVDWTMTYSHRSDFFDPPFRLVPVSGGGAGGGQTAHAGAQQVNHAEGRRHLLLILVSNCQPLRLHFFRRLQAMLPRGAAHVYGGCGDPCPCPGRNESDACYQRFFSRYKFYAAFENSRCEGYVTEKFQRGLLRGMVPLAMGGLSRKDYNRLGVPNSAFAHVDDFASMRELANWLQLVDRNDTVYNEFFGWRRGYREQDRAAIAEENLCKLCRAVSAPPSEQPEAKSFGDLASWWYSGTCIPSVPY